MSDPLDDPAAAKQTVANDAVAGETVIPGDVYGGPLGAEPREAEPIMWEHPGGAEDVELPDDEGSRS